MQFRRPKPSAGVFFDSDFAAIDNLLSVALLYGLQGKNDCRVAIITMSRPDLATAGFIDAVERFYHGPSGNFSQLPPIGMRTEGAPAVTPAAFIAPFARMKPDGKPVYRNEVKTAIDTGDPNTMFRNYLAAQYPQNSFFVLAGPATNLAALLEFRGMKEAIAAKVRYLVVAGGAFPDGPAEAHIKADIPAAKKVFSEWPTPIVASGYEVGSALEFPGASIDKEFAAIPDHPVADAYRANNPMPYNTPSGSMAAALYAGRPKEGYFKLSDPGIITVRDDGRTSFAPSAQGRHQYLIFDPAQKDKILQTYVELASAKPVPPVRFRPPVVVDDEKKDVDPAADPANADPANDVVVPPQPQ